MTPGVGYGGVGTQGWGTGGTVEGKSLGQGRGWEMEVRGARRRGPGLPVSPQSLRDEDDY